MKAAINEVVDGETLGGAEMHAQRLGRERLHGGHRGEALAKLRDIVAQADWRAARVPAVRRTGRRCYDPSELAGIVGTDLTQPCDVREVIARIVDASELQEFKPGYGSTLVCGFGALHGAAGGHPRQQRRAVLASPR